MLRKFIAATWWNIRHPTAGRIALTAGFLTIGGFASGLSLYPSGPIPALGWVLLGAAISGMLALAGVVVVGMAIEEGRVFFRLRATDRTNPFLPEIRELVACGRQLAGHPGETVWEERRKLAEALKDLRDKPRQYSKQEREAIAASMLKSTQPDRDLALESARHKLHEYDRIAEETIEAIRS